MCIRDRYFGDAGVALSTAVMTIVVLIFGEISPKSLAKEAPESFSLFSAPILRACSLILTPFNFLFAQWKKLLSKMFRVSGDRGITEEELITMVGQACLLYTSCFSLCAWCTRKTPIFRRQPGPSSTSPSSITIRLSLIHI